MRLVSRWVMRRATRLVTNSHYSREEAAANVGHRPEPRHGRVPRRARPVRRAAAGEARADGADGRDRRPPQRASARGCGTFVQAAALLPDVEFVLAGRWDDGAADELREARDAERDAHRLGRAGRAERALPARLGVRAGLRARGVRPVGGGGDAGRLHSGHDARGRPARGRGRHRRPGRRARTRRSSRRRSSRRPRARRSRAGARRASGCSTLSARDPRARACRRW